MKSARLGGPHPAQTAAPLPQEKEHPHPVPFASDPLKTSQSGFEKCHWLVFGWNQPLEAEKPPERKLHVDLWMAHDGNPSLGAQPATQRCCRSKGGSVSTTALGRPRRVKTSVTNRVRLRKELPATQQHSKEPAPAPTTALPGGRTAPVQAFCCRGNHKNRTVMNQTPWGCQPAGTHCSSLDR